MIFVRRGLPVIERDFVILHELAALWFLRNGDAFRQCLRSEMIACDAVALALQAPRPVVRRLVDATDRTNFAHIAGVFGLSEADTALRVGEVCQFPIKVVAPTTRTTLRPGLSYTRGPAYDWQRAPVRSVRLTDGSAEAALVPATA